MARLRQGDSVGRDLLSEDEERGEQEGRTVHGEV